MKKILIPVMIVAALGLAVVGVGAGFAQQDNGAGDTFLSKVAARLGIGEDKLKTAVDEAYSETIDEQVAAGKLTQQQADQLKERGFDAGRMFGPGGGRFGFGGVDLMQSAATLLGLSTDDLMTQLKDGKSLADVAAAQGVSVDKLKSDLLAQIKTNLGTQVSEGKITQSQADDVYSRTESNIDQIVTNQGGFFGCGGMRGMRGNGPMSGPTENATPGSTVQPETGL